MKQLLRLNPNTRSTHFEHEVIDGHIEDSRCAADPQTTMPIRESVRIVKPDLRIEIWQMGPSRWRISFDAREGQIWTIWSRDRKEIDAILRREAEAWRVASSSWLLRRLLWDDRVPRAWHDLDPADVTLLSCEDVVEEEKLKSLRKPDQATTCDSKGAG